MGADFGCPAEVGGWQAVASPEVAVRGADAVVILTEWQSFRELTWLKLAYLMHRLACLFTP